MHEVPEPRINVLEVLEFIDTNSVGLVYPFRIIVKHLIKTNTMSRKHPKYISSHWNLLEIEDGEDEMEQNMFR